MKVLLYAVFKDLTVDRSVAGPARYRKITSPAGASRSTRDFLENQCR